MHKSPISIADVEAAAARLAPYLSPTPLREYPRLDAELGYGLRVRVKHENHQPTQSFKIRNGLNTVLARSAEERARGGIGASTGNHGLGIAYAGRLTGTPITVCVPLGNNAEKNAAITALGARLVESGATYDETVVECRRLQEEQGLVLLHSTNDPLVVAGAATMTLECLVQEPELDALVLALGGGSQAVGALTVAAALRPSLKIYAVGATTAPAQYESWKTGQMLERQPANTFAEGIATGSAYALTFEALRAGLAGFVQVSEEEMRAAIRDLHRLTGNLAEGAGAAGFAGLRKLAPQLEGQRVGIAICGGNLSLAELRRTFAAA
jgi:threonine dehydratase